MTAKERVLAALSHQEADQVPAGEYAYDYRIIEALLGRPTFYRAKAKLVKALWEGRRDEVVASQKRDLVDLVEATGADIVAVTSSPIRGVRPPVPRQLDETTWEGEQGNQLSYSPFTEDIGVIRKGEKRPAAGPALPETWDDSETELARYVMEQLGRTHFVVARLGRVGTGVSFPSGFGLEGQYLRIADDPEGLQRALLAAAEETVKLIEPYMRIGVDGIFLEQDYGCNTGPFMSPRHFREIYFPAMQRECEIVHAAGKPVFFHSCGDNRLLLDMMVEAGMDCYQAIQPVEHIETIKARYGKRLALWGGVATSSLERAAPEQIRQEVLFSLKHCGPGGGFILGASHSVTVGAKPDNYRTVLETHRRCGAYPIAIPGKIPEPNWAMA